MNFKMDSKRKMNLKKNIAVVLAFAMMAVITVPVFSEPEENAPADPVVENPAPRPETDEQPIQEPVTDPNADPGTDPNALPQVEEVTEDLSENVLMEDDTDYYGLYDEFLYEDEEEPYTGPFDETEATVSGSLSTGSLSRLINEAVPGEETLIELNKDVSISSQLIVDGGRRISIDLKGHSLVSTGRGRSIRRAGFAGKYDVFVGGDGTVLNIKDSGDKKTGRGRYVVSENNGIAVFKGAALEISDAVLEQNDELYYVAAAKEGGKITVSKGSVSGNLDNSNGGIISLYGGKYTVEPKREFLAKDHGYVIYKAAPLYRYEVREKTRVYIKPVIDDGFLINGISLSESGVRKELFDEEGKRIGGTGISGGRFVETDENGKDPRALSASMIYGESGSVHYMTVLDDDYPNEIEISDAADKNVLLTDIFDIINRSEADSASAVSFTAEDPGLGDLSIGLKENKKLYAGRPLRDPFEIFDVTYTHGDAARKLDKNSNVRFTFDSGEDTYSYADKEGGSIVTVKAAYRGNEAVAEVTVEKQPVVIVGNDESTLVGEELSHRYYQKISVYPVNPDGTVDTAEPLSVNSPMIEWTDVTSSVLDLTGVENDKPGVYEKVELSDVYMLKEDKSRNYELVGRGYLKYTVEPSIVLEFMTPDSTEPIADKRILETDSKSCIVGMFKNGKPSSDVRWMVMSPDRKMVDSSKAGITVKPANNGNGAVFSFDESIRKEGGTYKIYEVDSRVRITGKIDEDTKLSVKPIAPVVYTGNKFAASDDMRYFEDGSPRKGYSPVLDIRVYDGKKKLEIGRDYVLSYRNNKKAQEPGSKKSPVVIITGKGDYAGAKIRAYFTIMP